MTWGAIGAAAVGVIGGAMTSKSGSKSGSSPAPQEMDPAMRPYIFGGEGQKGLLNYNSEQLARSQSPERQQMWGGMMNRGQQLMGGSVAGNPFSQGYTGGGFFGQNGPSGNGLGRAPEGLFMAPPAPPPPPPAAGPTLDQIMAEIERRRLAEQQSSGILNYAQGAD